MSRAQISKKSSGKLWMGPSKKKAKLDKREHMLLKKAAAAVKEEVDESSDVDVMPSGVEIENEDQEVVMEDVEDAGKF